MFINIVRHRTSQIIDLLQGDEKIQEERKKARESRNKYVGMGSDFRGFHTKYTGMGPNSSSYGSSLERSINEEDYDDLEFRRDYETLSREKKKTVFNETKLSNSSEKEVSEKVHQVPKVTFNPSSTVSTGKYQYEMKEKKIIC
jgi:hypothetical protein